MATPPEKLAGSLAALQSLQERGIVAVRAGVAWLRGGLDRGGAKLQT